MVWESLVVIVDDLNLRGARRPLPRQLSASVRLSVPAVTAANSAFTSKRATKRRTTISANAMPTFAQPGSHRIFSPQLSLATNSDGASRTKLGRIGSIGRVCPDDRVAACVGIATCARHISRCPLARSARRVSPPEGDAANPFQASSNKSRLPNPLATARPPVANGKAPRQDSVMWSA
jgi:hypothetical protein